MVTRAHADSSFVDANYLMDRLAWHSVFPIVTGEYQLEIRTGTEYGAWNGFPDWPLFLWCHRGTDPSTGRRFEMKRPVLLDPATRLRAVKSRPGYAA